MVAIRWADGVEADLDAERRRPTVQALGRSVLGLDLDVHEPPATTSYQLATEVLQVCRPDPRRDAPLERALIKTTDPSTGLACPTRRSATSCITRSLFSGNDRTIAY